MSLRSQLADIFGVRPAVTEVRTRSAFGESAFVKWDPEARWFFWRWARDPSGYKPLEAMYTRRIHHALERRSPVLLRSWELSVYDALIAAGVETLDPAYHERNATGNPL